VLRPQTSTGVEPFRRAQVLRLAACSFVVAAYGCGSAPEFDRLPLGRGVVQNGRCHARRLQVKGPAADCGRRHVAVGAPR
jgi:hypothetical protein